MGFLSPPTPPAPTIPEPPEEDDASIEEERRKAVIGARKSKGRAASLLTGGEGATGTANVQRNTLLGGNG